MADYSHLLPYELRDKEIFLMALDLLNYIDENEVTYTGSELFDNLITKVFSEYESEEAVLAYFNLAIRPQLGTHEALRTLLKLLNIDGEITEWFETGDTSFEFGVNLTTIPATVDVAKFVELVYLIKNERSWLISLHKLACMGGMVWDESSWDDSCWEIPHLFDIGFYDVVEINYP